MSSKTYPEKVLLAAKRSREERLNKSYKKPRKRVFKNLKNKIKVEIPFSNFTNNCNVTNCKYCTNLNGKCKNYKYLKAKYDEEILHSLQLAIKQPKSIYRGILGYRHRGDYEKYVVRAFRKNYSLKDGDKRKIKHFSPFDMLSDRRFDKIVQMTQMYITDKKRIFK
jgi:hypothetical protein